jgi:hypothetical protein
MEWMARPERFELPTTWFEAKYSIQLSYGRVGPHSSGIREPTPSPYASETAPSRQKYSAEPVFGRPNLAR